MKWTIPELIQVTPQDLFKGLEVFDAGVSTVSISVKLGSDSNGHVMDKGCQDMSMKTILLCVGKSTLIKWDLGNTVPTRTDMRGVSSHICVTSFMSPVSLYLILK